MNEDFKIQNLINSEEFQELKTIGIKLLNERADFDIIELFENLIDENAWSRIFSFLINSERNHNLGQVFLREWAKKIKNSEFDKFVKNLPDLNNSKIKTITEWTTKKNRRIDIMVLIQDLNHRTHSVIGIENKLYSDEGQNQLSDYQDAIIENYPEQNKIMFFLTPNGRNSITSIDNSSCPCVEIDYNTLSDTCLEIVNENDNNQINLFLKSISKHILKMNNENFMEEQIKSIISKIYSDKENREAINILINNLPNISNVFEKLEQYFSTNNNFDISIFQTKEFKLHTKKLDKLAAELEIGFCYMLHYNGNSPDIDDFIVFRLMLMADHKELGKDRVLELQRQFKFPNNLNEEKNWWQWKSIWTGDSYKLVDLGEKDFEGLKKLLETSIEQTYDILKQKILNYKKNK
jgi:hypothetical protein